MAVVNVQFPRVSAADASPRRSLVYESLVHALWPGQPFFLWPARPKPRLGRSTT